MWNPRNSTDFLTSDAKKPRAAGRPLLRSWVFALAVLSVGAIAPVQSADAAENSLRAFLSGKQTVPAPDGFNGVCGRHQWVCTPARSGGQSGLDMDLVGKVNQKVNRQVRQIEDLDQYKVEEYWTLPTARGGDCEDIAMQKMHDLMAAGVDPSRLFLATVLDRKNRNHAVLVVRTEGGDFVLDSQTSRIVHWTKTGYSFIRMQDPASRSRWQSLFVGGKFS